jgi:hypothetical protein
LEDVIGPLREYLKATRTFLNTLYEKRKRVCYASSIPITYDILGARIAKLDGKGVLSKSWQYKGSLL